MILIDRRGEEHRINPALIKDLPNLQTDIYIACQTFTLDNLKSYINQYEYKFDFKENKEAIDKLLPYICNDTAVFDLVMAKQALTWYLGLSQYYDAVPYKAQGNNGQYSFIFSIIKGEINMIDKLEVGTNITDRNGKEFKAYSYLINEYFEAMELLTKVDTANISNNIGTDDESFIALMEILYRTFDRKIPKEEILASLDAEFARNAIKVYYDII